MTNLYHIIDHEPALTKEDISIELNDLAARLVDSGLMRIDAYNQINFARFVSSGSNISTMFSRRQLIDPKLLPITRNLIRKAFIKSDPSQIESKIDKAIIKLKSEIQKYIPVSYKMEMKLARILVQTSHPVVIELVLLEQVQVFISYAHNIGDVLDIPTWKEAGTNSGMQSTDGRETSIYVSCGGDPLQINKEDDSENKNEAPQDEVTYGSGKPALARALIIGGQEFGHYSDIIRDKKGRYIARHSAHISGAYPTPTARIARIKDIENIKAIKNKLINIGIFNIIELERHVKFYRKNKLNNIRAIFSKFFTKIRRIFFMLRVKKANLRILFKFKKDLYPATLILAMLDDMAFNLAPEADVYKNPDKNIEEAIACIEALARVPQQCNKWGHNITKFAFPNLYKIYYDNVIPSCIEAYENLSGKIFTLYPDNFTYISFYQRIFIKLTKKVKYIYNRK